MPMPPTPAPHQALQQGLPRTRLRGRCPGAASPASPAGPGGSGSAALDRAPCVLLRQGAGAPRLTVLSRASAVSAAWSRRTRAASTHSFIALPAWRGLLVSRRMRAAS